MVAPWARGGERTSDAQGEVMVAHMIVVSPNKCQGIQNSAYF